ncbi:hypothetical protein [Pseudomaricurvus alkylphenolicus]|uniref:hypothetical protein n=1 Tax=Pseudomaricurvus alkylphenolicus TaxID=1306991 RepID=UPI001420576C|nr:hypothetical protein [Pseudomaricurvus alkylphenolicus]
MDLDVQLKEVEALSASATAQLKDQQSSADKQANLLSAMEAKLADAEAAKQQTEVELATLRAELTVKDPIFEKLGVDYGPKATDLSRSE